HVLCANTRQPTMVCRCLELFAVVQSNLENLSRFVSDCQHFTSSVPPRSPFGVRHVLIKAHQLVARLNRTKFHVPKIGRQNLVIRGQARSGKQSLVGLFPNKSKRMVKCLLVTHSEASANLLEPTSGCRPVRTAAHRIVKLVAVSHSLNLFNR